MRILPESYDTWRAILYHFYHLLQLYHSNRNSNTRVESGGDEVAFAQMLDKP